jgi:anti-sigma regulatory factor (Ser/Thr protein kinase)
MAPAREPRKQALGGNKGYFRSLAGHDLRVAEESEIFAARRAVRAFARWIGLDEERSGRAAPLVTEMAINLVKYAGGGEIVVDRFADEAAGGRAARPS